MPRRITFLLFLTLAVQCMSLHSMERAIKHQEAIMLKTFVAQRNMALKGVCVLATGGILAGASIMLGEQYSPVAKGLAYECAFWSAPMLAIVASRQYFIWKLSQ